MPISTADCKALLAAHFTAHPSLIEAIYGKDPANDPEHTDFVLRAISDSQTPSKWKREGKWSAAKYFEEYGGTHRGRGGLDVVSYYAGAILQELPASEVKAVRKFYLDSSVYDSAIGYCVFETLNATLYISEYVGD